MDTQLAAPDGKRPCGHVAFRMALAGSRGDEDLRSILVVAQTPSRRRAASRGRSCAPAAAAPGRRTPVSIPGGCRRRHPGSGRGCCRCGKPTPGAIASYSLRKHSRERDAKSGRVRVVGLECAVAAQAHLTLCLVVSKVLVVRARGLVGGRRKYPARARATKVTRVAQSRAG